jgi:ABC-type lipoprotein release transport system permease subunit
VLELHVPVAEVGAISAATSLLCLAAAALPGRRAARLEPAAAVRNE